MNRTAQTRRGKTVSLNSMMETEGGWFSYVVDRRGYAVMVFIPNR
jgi:hypothetical protein